MWINQEIIENLYKICQSRGEIGLMNVYKGIPINFSASIIQVVEDSVIVRTDPQQIICLDKERETFISHNSFPGIIRGSVMEISMPKRAAVLSRFEYMGNHIGTRSDIRAEPHATINGILEPKFTPAAAVKGELADISSRGIGFYLEPEFFIPGIFVRSTNISLNFQIPTPNSLSPVDLKVDAVIENVKHEMYYDRYRIGASMELDKTSTTIIIEFIKSRHQQLEREIQQRIQDTP